MYFIFVSNDIDAVRNFEAVLQQVDSKKILITVSNGYDLIDYLQNVKRGESYPDLIILTPKYLRISGTDLLELLKTDDFYRLIPVLMLMPDDNPHHEEVCTRLGSEFMPAPHGKEELLYAVDRMCAACSE
jgi:CheY-like chemotaxis protein